MTQPAQIVAECGHCRRKWMFPPASAGHAVPCPNCRALVQVTAPPPAPAKPAPADDLSNLDEVDEDVVPRRRYRPQAQFPFAQHMLSTACGVLAALLVAAVLLCVISNLVPPAIRDIFTIRVRITT